MARSICKSLLLTTSFLMTTMPCGCSSQTDTGRVPRQVAIQESELGVLRTITGRTAAGVEVSLTVRSYNGKQSGFWGAETSPPFDLLWSLDFVIGEDHIQVPSQYLRDLSNILLSPTTQTIESLVAINPDRLAVRIESDGYEVRLSAGDGANAYEASIEMRSIENEAMSLNRTVRYLMDDPEGPWG